MSTSRYMWYELPNSRTSNSQRLTLADRMQAMVDGILSSLGGLFR